MGIRGLENEILEIRTEEDMIRAGNLPLLILIQKPSSRKVYRIDNAEEFFEEVFKTKEGNPFPFPPVSKVEAGCRKYGKAVSEESIKHVKVYPFQQGFHGVDYFYIMYRAEL